MFNVESGSANSEALYTLHRMGFGARLSLVGLPRHNRVK